MTAQNIKLSVQERLNDAKVGFSSKKNLYNYLQTKEAPEKGTIATYNEDLLPTPPGQWGNSKKPIVHR